MADTDVCSRDNGVGQKKRRETLSGSDSVLKKIKLENGTPLEANPNTIEAIREKNKALGIDIKEKNRRVAYLTKKCETLYRSREITSASFCCVRRQWLQLQDELLATLKTVDPCAVSDETCKEAWHAALEAVDDFGQVRVHPEDLLLHLPEWFSIVPRDGETAEPDADALLPMDDVADDGTLIKTHGRSIVETKLHAQLGQKSEKMKELLRKLLAVAADCAESKAKSIEYAHILQAKRAAVAETLDLKGRLHTCKTRITELERDVEIKEIERHRACRDYDRLSAYVEQSGDVKADDVSESDSKSKDVVDTEQSCATTTSRSPNSETAQQEAIAKKEMEHATVVTTMRENMGILSTKLYQERQKLELMRRELEKFKAMEVAWKNDEAVLVQAHKETIKQLQDEKAHADEEYNELLHKSKDLEHHMTDKWEKKISKIQAEMSKTKSQMDELNLKNVSLREKISNASTYRDQLSEVKPELESCKRENVKLKAQIEREQNRADRAQVSADNREIQTLTQKVSLLTKEKLDLHQTFDMLKNAEMKGADEKLSDAFQRLSEVENKLEKERQEHHDCRTEREILRAGIEDLKTSSEASREENDALLLEIDTISKEVNSLRHGRKKYIQQIEEKRKANKKLHTLLAREEQAKAHCFEELAAVRLQVSSLSTVHKHQKTFIESSKESLEAKEAELEKMKEYVETLETEREASDAEKRKVLRDAEVSKKVCEAVERSQREQRLLQERQKSCENCTVLRKKMEDVERELQHFKSATCTGELTDLERFELRDLQKLVNCSVCQDRRKDVIISKCFHMFCKDCIDTNLKARNRKCPTCKKMFGQDDVKTVWFT
uniref:E3 ubiquitin protein ligase n=1 Tax=Peronospora matthiolae TaxID=2874970 RepID=A0AAV1V4V6_9STRA